MLFPRSHAWTPLQKWFVAMAAVFAIAILAAVVYGYERYYRGPNESALFGTWSEGDDSYYRFYPNHNVELWSDFPSGRIEDLDLVSRGRWYAGGDFIYLRFPDMPADRNVELARRNILIWRIDAISPTELRAHMWQEEPPRIYRRVDLPLVNASNQTLQPTASPRE
jgi:hypothetical protein